MNRICSKTQIDSPRFGSGFTLVELMIVIAVGAIFTMLALPNFSAVLHKNRLTAASGQLYVSLNTARNEAVKRRDPVRVCPTADNTSCRNDGIWTEGWVIFQDANSNNSPDSSEIIRVGEPLHTGVSMQVTNTMSAFVQFEPSGAATGNGGNIGEFRICHLETNSNSRSIRVSASGRVSAADRAQTDCNASE